MGLGADPWRAWTQLPPPELGRHGAGAGQALTAYQAFFRLNFNEMRAAARADWQAHGGTDKFMCPTNVIVRTIGERWRSMSPAQVQAFANSTGSIAPGQKKPQGIKRKRRMPKKVTAKAKAKAKAKGKGKGKAKAPPPKQRVGPKRAMTAYQLFFREHEGQLSGKTEGYTRMEGMTQNIIVKTIGERWRALQHDPESRAVWTRMEEEEKQRYARELAAGVGAGAPNGAVDTGAPRIPSMPSGMMGGHMVSAQQQYQQQQPTGHLQYLVPGGQQTQHQHQHQQQQQTQQHQQQVQQQQQYQQQYHQQQYQQQQYQQHQVASGHLGAAGIIGGMRGPPQGPPVDPPAPGVGAASLLARYQQLSAAAANAAPTAHAKARAPPKPPS